MCQRRRVLADAMATTESGVQKSRFHAVRGTGPFNDLVFDLHLDFELDLQLADIIL